MLTREMSITHKEFLRLLPLAVQGASVNRRDNRLTVKTASGRLTITLAPQTTRKLGLLEFPVTTVTMEFHDFNPSDQAAFLKRFDLAYQRGGG
ncbi:MAG: hypothetical protein OXE97_10630 [Gammaproteobacteria bacterium]|nr:hypothetical protein [Gammaproteobacteria bacterium]MCY4281477.1 hypothetical protein [Gammaproteobacteria bacterium]